MELKTIYKLLITPSLNNYMSRRSNSPDLTLAIKNSETNGRIMDVKFVYLLLRRSPPRVGGVPHLMEQ